MLEIRTLDTIKMFAVLITFIIIIMGIMIVLQKMTVLYDKQQSLCEQSGGVVITYECYESVLSINRCSKVETGQFCTYPNGTKYKMVYE